VGVKNCTPTFKTVAPPLSVSETREHTCAMRWQGRTAGNDKRGMGEWQFRAGLRDFVRTDDRCRRHCSTRGDWFATSSTCTADRLQPNFSCPARRSVV